MSDYQLTEINETGETIRELIVSSTQTERHQRIDFVRPTQNVRTSLQAILDVFLPAGFPHSVTNDYVEYQIYDSLQAFASSIAGLLSSRAVLSSLGVGDASSTATAAVVLNVLQESLGRLSTIFFAHRYGTLIEPECKMYRLLADILNDCAFVLDCLSPALPPVVRVVALTSSGVLRALCGVAAGSAKACLSAHFAQRGNIAELNAKDSSQETVISLLGMLCGTLVVTTITGSIATWTALIFLLAMHLELNRRAVRAVSMTTLNRQRAGLVYHHLANGKVPKPDEISKAEKIFETGGALRAADGRYIGTCKIGIGVQSYFNSVGELTSAGSVKIDKTALASLLMPFKHSSYVLWYDDSTLNEKIAVSIVLKQGSTSRDQVVAWWHATALVCHIDNARRNASIQAKNLEESVFEVILKEASAMMTKYEKPLQEAGWDLEGSKLESRSGSRLVIK